MASGRLRFDIRQAGREMLLVFVTVLMLNALFYIFFVRPRTEEYRALTTESAPRIAELENREARVRRQEAYLLGLEQAESDLTRFRTEILSTRDQRMIDVQMELARLAQQFNINVEQIQYQNDRLDDEALDRFAMLVPLEGGYANLRKFIQAVETSEKFLVIERVALAEGEQGGILLQLNITLATYFDLPEFQKDRRSERRGERRA